MPTAYTELAEIEGEFKTIKFTDTSLVKAATVEDFISEANALIDAHVATRYVIPIPNTADGFLMLKTIARTLVGERVRRKLEVKQTENQSAIITKQAQAQAPAAAGLNTRDALKLLERIKSGEIVLVGATKLSSGSGISSFTTNNNITPVFDKNTPQW